MHETGLQLRRMVRFGFPTLLACTSPLAAQSATDVSADLSIPTDAQGSGLQQSPAEERVDRLPDATVGRKVVKPLARLNNRIESRIEARISNRIDRETDTDADPRSPVEAAERRMRASSKPEG